MGSAAEAGAAATSSRQRTNAIGIGGKGGTDGDGRPDGQDDSDRDHLSNAAEDQTGNDPRDRDTDNDGIIDGREQAGVVTAYAGGRLTIDIANGGTINGLVDAGTELRCESEQEAEHGWSRAARRSLRAGAATDDENQDPVVDDGDPGDDGTDGHGQPDGHHGHEGGSARPLSRLKAGTRVHEAELETGPNGARFASIELLR